MKKEYFLKTKRIGFSTWQNEDLDMAKLLWGNEKVTQYICASGKFNEDEIIQRLKQEIENERKYKIQYWPFYALDSNEFIGCCGLRPYIDGKYEIGFHLRPKFWRQNYATEAAEAIISYAFTELEIEALFAGHHPDNVASFKVLEKLDFCYIGKNYYKPTGLYHPSYRLKKYDYVSK